MSEIDQDDLPNLDYAFLANYTQVDANGTLTSVGASFTYAVVPTLPSGHLVYVAGRLRMAEDGPPFPLTISFKGPEPSAEITLELLVSRGNEQPYAGKVGVLFAAATVVPLMAEGLVEVTIRVNGQEVRRLAFSVTLTPPAP